MFDGIVSPPIVTRSGTRSTIVSMMVLPNLGENAVGDPDGPHEPPEAACGRPCDDLASSRNDLFGLLIVFSAGKAGPGLVAQMMKSA